MEIASVVVEIQRGAGEAVLSRLALMPSVTVYGLTENQIVTVIEGNSPAAVQEVLKDVQMLDEVIGVYPVFIGEDDEDSAQTAGRASGT